MSKPDVSSSEIPPHPGEVTHHMRRAVDHLRTLRDAATARGDEPGARAWEEIADGVMALVQSVETARGKQTWSAKRTVPCETCKR